MRNHKRGGFIDAMNMVVMIPTFILIAFGIGVLVYGVTNDKLDTSEFDSYYIDSYTSQLINTPQCFAYQDLQTERVDYGVVDQQKLTNQRLIECMSYAEPRRQLPIMIEITNLETRAKQTFTTNTWSASTNSRKTVGKQVTMITNDLKREQILIRIAYGNPRMIE